MAAFRCVGQLGRCRVKTSSADIQLDHTGRLEVNTGGGAIVVDRVAGHVEVSTGSGKVRVLQIDGTAVIKNSNGDIWVGEITGDVRLNAANGDISVDHAHAGITANTANGDVRIGEITRGSAALMTAFGEIEIGIHPGAVARLDVHTSFGRVHNHMDTADGPESCDETVEVRANTSYGDIEIRHSSDPERTHRMEPA